MSFKFLSLFVPLKRQIVTAGFLFVRSKNEYRKCYGNKVSLSRRAAHKIMYNS